MPNIKHLKSTDRPELYMSELDALRAQLHEDNQGSALTKLTPPEIEFEPDYILETDRRQAA
jgi:hypothetical protein